MQPSLYLMLGETLADRVGGELASYHLFEGSETFEVRQPPRTLPAPLAGSTMATSFNGLNSFAYFGSAPACRALSFWVCPETTDGEQYFVSRLAPGREHRVDFAIGQKDGCLQVEFGTGTSTEFWQTEERRFQAGIWTHVALVFVLDGLEIFIDGRQIADTQIKRPENSLVDTQVLATNRGPLFLGADPAASQSANENEDANGLHGFFDGAIDGLALWDWSFDAEGITNAAILQLACEGPPDFSKMPPANDPGLEVQNSSKDWDDEALTASLLGKYGTQADIGADPTSDPDPDADAPDTPAETAAPEASQANDAALAENEAKDEPVSDAAAPKAPQENETALAEDESEDKPASDAAASDPPQASEAAFAKIGAEDEPIYFATAAPNEGIWDELKSLVTSINGEPEATSAAIDEVAEPPTELIAEASDKPEFQGPSPSTDASSETVDEPEGEAETASNETEYEGIMEPMQLETSVPAEEVTEVSPVTPAYAAAPPVPEAINPPPDPLVAADDAGSPDSPRSADEPVAESEETADGIAFSTVNNQAANQSSGTNKAISAFVAAEIPAKEITGLDVAAPEAPENEIDPPVANGLFADTPISGAEALRLMLDETDAPVADDDPLSIAGISMPDAAPLPEDTAADIAEIAEISSSTDETAAPTAPEPEKSKPGEERHATIPARHYGRIPLQSAEIEEAQRKRLRDALFDVQTTPSIRSRFNIFGSRRKSGALHEPSREFTPKAKPQDQRPSTTLHKDETAEPKEFGPPAAVALVPNYAAKLARQRRQNTAVPALKAGKRNPQSAARLDEMAELHADELHFR